MKRLLYILLLILPQIAFAQKASLSLTVSDTVSAEATIPADSLAAHSLRADTLIVDSLPATKVPLHERLDSVVANSGLLETSQIGLMIYDLDADSVLYALGERQTLRPASTMKVITAVSALDRLGGSYQFKTILRQTGEVVDSIRTLVGDVYLVGGMDPRLGRDDLAAFAESLKKQDIDTIRGSLCLDFSMKDADLLGEGWCWDDDNPVLSPLVYKRKNQLGEYFLDVLEKEGIIVTDSIVNRRSPSNAKEICMRSHSIDQILMRMMKESDNLYAESVFYNMAASKSKPATAKVAADIEKSLIRKIGLDPSRYRIADGSGLSLYNYVTAELEVMMLRYAYRNSNIFNHLYMTLPVAGVDGTLSKRMRGSSAAGNVHAKTGSVSSISSLAGYATSPDNHRLAFCIINQGVMHSVNARNFQNQICIEMTR